MPHFIHIKETPSTNTYAMRLATALPSGTVVYTYVQTAGRGQRGNSWESEPGKNLSFSQIVRDIAVAPAQQFYLSEAVSLAVAEFLGQYTGEISIKWPNDIYWRDLKICGILIELTLQGGKITAAVIGVGLNVNQTTFRSPAPNPVSLAQITGREIELDAALRQVCGLIERYTDFSAFTTQDFAKLHQRYLSLLYRRDGRPHRFSLPDGTQLDATIIDVLPDGTLCLELPDGTVGRYAFKEVAFVI